MFSHIYYFRYPQYVWSKRIAEILQREIRDIQRLVILDAPCGDGIVSFWLSNKFTNNSLVATDISEEKIHTARRRMGSDNVILSSDDLHRLDLDETKRYCWLLVNSLYLLPENEILFERFSGGVQYVVGIFPYIDHENYRHFQRRYPEFQNISARTKDDTLRFFDRMNFETILVEDIVSYPFHKYYGNALQRMVFSTLFNILDRDQGQRKAFWLGLFKNRRSNG